MAPASRGGGNSRILTLQLFTFSYPLREIRTTVLQKIAWAEQLMYENIPGWSDEWLQYFTQKSWVTVCCQAEPMFNCVVIYFRVQIKNSRPHKNESVSSDSVISGFMWFEELLKSVPMGFSGANRWKHGLWRLNTKNWNSGQLSCDPHWNRNSGVMISFHGDAMM